MFMHDFDFNYREPERNLPQEVDVSQLNYLIDRQDAKTIIKSEHLFYLAWCQAFSKASKDKSNFKVTVIDNKMTIDNPYAVGDKVKVTLEIIRSFIIRGMQDHKDITILLPSFCRDIFFEEDSDKIDLSKKKTDFPKSIFNDYTKQGLKGLFESCCAIYSDEKKEIQLRKSDYSKCFEVKKVKTIRIKWQKSCHLTYPITPKNLTEPKDFRKEFYTLYQQQQFCDLTLMCPDGSIKINSTVLHLSGGALFQTLLASSMKETTEKNITFPDHSLATIKTFADFIYLGGKPLLEKLMVADQDINLFEMLSFGFTYMIGDFIDCCTNAISLHATPNDFKTIQLFAEQHNNAHLHALCKKMLEDFLISLPKDMKWGDIVKEIAGFAHFGKDTSSSETLLLDTKINLYQVLEFAKRYEINQLIADCENSILIQNALKKLFAGSKDGQF